MERVRQQLRSFKLKIKENIPNRVKRFAQTLQRYFIECCENSNIHGIRYFTTRAIHWSERLWWIIAVALSLWWCSTMIHDVWLEWNRVPTKSELTKHAQINAMAHICLNYLDHKIELKNDFTSESIYKIIEEVAPNVEYTFKECSWQQKRIKCSDYISPIFTDLGLCFTFNALNSCDKIVPHKMASGINRNSTGWSLEDGYSQEYSENEYPFRVFESGRKGALELVLTTYVQDHDIMCIGPTNQGFSIHFSTPGESVQSSDSVSYSQFIGQSEEALIAIKPKVNAISNRLRNSERNLRRCVFNSERPLRFFKSYTFRNCFL